MCGGDVEVALDTSATSSTPLLVFFVYIFLPRWEKCMKNYRCPLFQQNLSTCSRDKRLDEQVFFVQKEALAIHFFRKEINN
jgi:hypothetical protein